MSKTTTSSFLFTPELSKKFLLLRLKYDKLFKTHKQAWYQFLAILQKKHNFPDELNVDQCRKKWSYNYDSYKLAKKTNNTSWKYFKMFDKHYAAAKTLDKFESWNEDWRGKLISAVVEAADMKLSHTDMWRTVEMSLRSQNLPIDCYIQDVKNLWHHLKVTFGRKLAISRRSKKRPQWEHYGALQSYFLSHEREALAAWQERGRAPGKRRRVTCHVEEAAEQFHWTKDMTESFIQVRLQNESLFRENSQAWGRFRNELVDLYRFPKSLTSTELGKKWNTIYREYQKAVAKNKTSWLYYKLFERYLGEGSINPIVGWSDEYLFMLIQKRTELEPMFAKVSKHRNLNPWRDVEKALRKANLPLENSLLDLPAIWSHLHNTYKWKKKFANKGVLADTWQFYEAMRNYDECASNKTSENKIFKVQKVVERSKSELQEIEFDDPADDSYEDDIKLFDLKKRLQPKVEVEVSSCRACSSRAACVGVFAADGAGRSAADKMAAVCGLEVEESDDLPKLLCLNCVRDLENAFEFRERCRRADSEMRKRVPKETAVDNQPDIKIEYDNDIEPETEPEAENTFDDITQDFHEEVDDELSDIEEYRPPQKKRNRIYKRKEVKKEDVKKKVAPKIKKKYPRYEYTQICEVCGVTTRNLGVHLESHSTAPAHECPVCHKRFKFKSGLFVHKKTHDPEPMKTCEVCGKTFHIMAQYRRHFVYHANERKHACETCGKRFNSPDILRVHMRIHTDERPYSCPDCGKHFRTMGCVSRHRRIVHKKTKASVPETE